MKKIFCDCCSKQISSDEKMYKIKKRFLFPDKEKMASAQAYAWFYWDLTKADKKSYVHWIRRMNKK